MVIGDSELLFRADHSLGEDAANLRRLEFSKLTCAPIVEFCSQPGEGNPDANTDIGSTANHGVLLLAYPHGGKLKPISMGVFFQANDLSDRDILPPLADSLDATGLEPGHG
ncbi:MAG: hypothetical protein DDT27_01582 [Dehalococcoidia bacterium]|nr:hypothetical protein [Chloroflexota bacterium]